jgi:UDP-3-O-[3-hydroxymyristoyl] glucosamine N-acyltransferase
LKCLKNRGRTISGYGFFEKEADISLSVLAQRTDSALVKPEDADIKISSVAPLDEAGIGDISYLTSARYLNALKATRATACFIPEEFIEKAPSHIALLKTFQPHLAYAKALVCFYPDAVSPISEIKEKGIHDSARIDPSAKIEAGVIIEAGAIIGAGVQIGSGTIISAYAVIGKNCALGRNCFVGAHCSISNTLIGNEVLIHTGARLGQSGFGYVQQMTGAVRVPQIGRVVIQDHVEIGANTTIDRGSTRDTTIGEHTKIDNLVHIAHNVSVGRHCFIAGQVGIAGSVVLEDYVILLGQVGVADGAHIGAGARIGAKSGVLSKVPAGKDIMGYPAKDLKQFLQEQGLLTKLWKARKKKTRGE